MVAVRTASSRPAFTLVEIFIVLTLMTVVTAVGVQYYRKAVQRAKLAAMRDDLKKMRDGIEKFNEMFGRYPKEISELEGKLLKEIPRCPFTGASDWVKEPPPETKNARGEIVRPEGVYDVHCRLSDTGPEGKPLKDY